MLTLCAYERYCRIRRHENSSSDVLDTSVRTPHVVSFKWYGFTLLLFALGLLSKPMAVTLPFLLLLLDYWPLERFAMDNLRFTIWQLVREKIPFIVLSIVASALTMWGQEKSVEALDSVPVTLRFGNAVLSYVAYIGQLFWPTQLAAFYPHPRSIGAWQVTLATLLLITVSTFCCLNGRKHRYLAVGWFWYLGMLVPTIGIIQVGTFARADRYTYLSQIGLCMLIVWTATELSAHLRHRCQTLLHLKQSLAAVTLGTVGCVVLMALTVRAKAQVSTWRDSDTLWTHALASTRNNAVAENNVGHVLFQKNDLSEAILHFEKALQIKPHYHDARYNLATVQLQRGQFDNAIAQLRYLLQTRPDDADVRNNLGNALAQTGNLPEAIMEYQRTLQLEPHRAETLNNLAWVLATAPEPSLRNGKQAIALAEHANRLTRAESPLILHTLAAACAETGQFQEAIQNVSRAIQLAQNESRADLVEQFFIELKCYEAARPFHQTKGEAQAHP
jgi:protein O-mannosyl-transferase